jgi:type IV pilus assembly protein PilZ
LVFVSTPPSSERRRDVRAPIELQVEYKRLNSFFADYTRNISRDGMFIKTQKPLGIGTEFVFKLQVPQLDAPLELHGRVQWTVKPEQANAEQEPGMGIGFIYESETERQRVVAVVEKLMVKSLGKALYNKLVAERRRHEP